MKYNRRSFIKKTALAGGISLSPYSHIYPLKHAKNKELPVVGHGDYQYRVDKNWGVQNPAQYPVNDCHEMVIDKRNRIFMTTTHPQNNLLIYDRGGTVLGAWGTTYPGAHGLTLSEEGGEEFLYITDPESHKVGKTTLDGKKILELTYPKEIDAYQEASQFKPTETAIAPDGTFYVADGYGLDYIIHYDANGNYLRHFGGHGKGAAQFECCHGITVDYRAATPTLLITSRTANCFKRFTLDGEHIETIALPSCYICRPVIKNGKLYFAVIVTRDWGTYDGMLAVLDENNKVLSMPGGSTPTYQGNQLVAPVYDQKTFLNPHDVCIDDDENIYIPQWNSGKTYPLKLIRV
ncbi:MAG: 6-bladed beta-propeller [Flavobacteriaceae bacterium]